MSQTLSERQQREQAEFTARAAALTRPEINFDHYAHRRFGPWNPYWRVHDLVVRNYPPPRRLLSYGCGAGRSGLIYAQLGYSVAGIDICAALVDNARYLAEKYGFVDRAVFTVQAAERLDYSDESFDVVVGEDVLHHINLGEAIPELYRVLKPGGVAIFKDSLATPLRDSLRRRPPITWFLPLGTKNRMTGELYCDTPDERMLTQGDLDLLRRHFPEIKIERFHVLTLLAKVFGNRPFFERCDWWLFRVLPVLRRFGDNVVIILKKGDDC